MILEYLYVRFDIQDILFNVNSSACETEKPRFYIAVNLILFPISDSRTIPMSFIGNNGRAREKPQICFVWQARFSSQWYHRDSI